ncbi:CpsD/CapB family tyrosine-protein kinase [Mycoplasmatota bacterium]|nr:CpsD/CapB family tyrosine-protein kinase [Mycoplasmatota bacterium]
MIEEKIITLKNPQSYLSEIYRRVRTNIEFASIDTKIKTVNVTSTSADETKTTTACNLAVMYASKFEKVLLVDSDLRKPTVHRFLNVNNSVGLTDCMLAYSNQNSDISNINLNDFIKKIEHPSMTHPLHVMTSGTKINNAAEFLGSNTFKSLLSVLKDYYDVIIVDSAPSGIIIDGLIVSSCCDATLYITVYNSTKLDQAKQVIDSLKKAGANVIGSIIAKTPVHKRLLNRYYYNNYYYRAEEEDE